MGRDSSCSIERVVSDSLTDVWPSTHMISPDQSSDSDHEYPMKGSVTESVELLFDYFPTRFRLVNRVDLPTHCTCVSCDNHYEKTVLFVYSYTGLTGLLHNNPSTRS